MRRCISNTKNTGALTRNAIYNRAQFITSVSGWEACSQFFTVNSFFQWRQCCFCGWHVYRLKTYFIHTTSVCFNNAHICSQRALLNIAYAYSHRYITGNMCSLLRAVLVFRVMRSVRAENFESEYNWFIRISSTKHYQKYMLFYMGWRNLGF